MTSLPEPAPSNKQGLLTPKLKTPFEVLGVSPDATSDQIEQAYNAKRDSHATPSDEDASRLEFAYEMLSDPNRRELYDILGESMLNYMAIMFTSYTAMLVLLLRLVSRSGVKTRYVPCVSVSPFFGLLYLGTVFFCLRADDVISWSWAAVFTPFWILNIAFFCLRGAALFTTKSSTEAKKRELFGFFRSSLLLVTQIFVVLKLDSNISWRLLIVLLPYFVYEVLGVPEAIASGGRAVLHFLLRVAQGLLLGFKVDGELGHVNWWLVLIPVWIFLAFKLIYQVRGLREGQLSLKDIVGIGFMCLIMDLPCFLLAARLSGGDSAFSSFYVVLPWLIPLTPVWVTLCFTAVDKQHEVDEPALMNSYKILDAE